jgi:hypothetical protein
MAPENILYNIDLRPPWSSQEVARQRCSTMSHVALNVIQKQESNRGRNKMIDDDDHQSPYRTNSKHEDYIYSCRESEWSPGKESRLLQLR